MPTNCPREQRPRDSPRRAGPRLPTPPAPASPEAELHRSGSRSSPPALACRPVLAGARRQLEGNAGNAEQITPVPGPERASRAGLPAPRRTLRARRSDCHPAEVGSSCAIAWTGSGSDSGIETRPLPPRPPWISGDPLSPPSPAIALQFPEQSASCPPGSGSREVRGADTPALAPLSDRRDSRPAGAPQG